MYIPSTILLCFLPFAWLRMLILLFLFILFTAFFFSLYLLSPLPISYFLVNL